jgi:peptide/nickel transport system substrate-binding protein
MAVWASPVTLNTYLRSQNVVDEVLAFTVEGLTRVFPDGTRQPILVVEIPTVQNGGVSADGKTVTFKLKEGLKFSDGAPLTCDDVKFTWQAVMTPESGVRSTTGYSDIEQIECPNPTTAVLRFKNFFAPYLTLFERGVLPKSAGDPKNMQNWTYNRKPIGTGPFVIDEWVADSHVTLSRNPNYREKDKPYLDQVVIRIVPSSAVAVQLLLSGDVDIMWNSTEGDLPQLEKAPGIVVAARPQIGGERIDLNVAENKDPSDPTKPHLILSDVRVRQAIAYGLDRQSVIDKLLYGKAKIGTSDLNEGFFSCDISAYPYDPEKAKKLLAEAGWVPGSDGIRVAKGAKVAPDGTRLRLKFTTTSGNRMREDSQVIWLENLKAIGVEMYIENAPSSVVLGSWDAGSPYKRGNYDIVLYGFFSPVDPHRFMVNTFTSAQVASEKNKTGGNVTRFTDPKIDEAMQKAGLEPDPSKRKDLYCQVAQIIREAAPTIYLYQRNSIHSYRDRVQGPVAGNSWETIGWSAANWWVK